MMKLITLFLFTATSSTTYAVKQIPMMVAPEIMCYEAFKSKVSFNQLPVGIRYKGKQVFAHYCKNSLTGKFIPWHWGLSPIGKGMRFNPLC